VKDQAGVTKGAQDAPAPPVVPYPTAGENPDFAAFLKDEQATDAGPQGTGQGDAGPPAAWTPAAVQETYKGIGEMIHAISGDPADKLQPYEVRVLANPNNLRFINRHLAADRGDDMDAMVFAITNGVFMGPRVVRNLKPIGKMIYRQVLVLLSLLGVAEVRVEKKAQPVPPEVHPTDTFTPTDE